MHVIHDAKEDITYFSLILFTTFGNTSFKSYRWKGNWTCPHWCRSICFNHGIVIKHKSWYPFAIYNTNHFKKLLDQICNKSILCQSFLWFEMVALFSYFLQHVFLLEIFIIFCIKNNPHFLYSPKCSLKHGFSANLWGPFTFGVLKRKKKLKDFLELPFINNIYMKQT